MPPRLILTHEVGKPYKHEHGREYWHYLMRMDKHSKGWLHLYKTPHGMICLYGKVMSFGATPVSRAHCDGCRKKLRHSGDELPQRICLAIHSSSTGRIYVRATLGLCGTALSPKYDSWVREMSGPKDCRTRPNFAGELAGRRPRDLNPANKRGLGNAGST